MNSSIDCEQEDEKSTDGDFAMHRIIVLDEMDNLLENTTHQGVLYKLFLLASGGTTSASAKSGKTGHTAVIGLANSLDLTERFLPLLTSRGRAPVLVQFQPFSAEEMIAIVKARLTRLQPRYDVDLSCVIGGGEGLQHHQEATHDPLPILTLPALTLAARKVAAVTGDLRKALDACRLAIEAVEMEQREHALRAVADADANAGTGSRTSASADSAQSLLSAWTPASAPKVTPQHVNRVLASVLGSTSLNKIRGLPLHAKFLLAAHLTSTQRHEAGLASDLFHGGSESGGGSISITEVQERYEKMLQQDGAFSPLEGSEIIDVLESMETQSVVQLATDASPSGSSFGASSTTAKRAVSQAAKRSGRKQFLTSHRVVRLCMSAEDVRKALITPSPLSSTVDQLSASSVAASADAVKRVLLVEENKIRRAKGWEQVAESQRLVRALELGGGRGAIADGF